MIKSRQKSEYNFNIDYPKRNRIYKRSAIEIRGWVFSVHCKKINTLQVKINGSTVAAKYGLERKDVLNAYQAYGNAALYSGFICEIPVKKADNEIIIEVDAGSGLEVVHQFSVDNSYEILPDGYYNEHLSVNYADHKNLIDGKKAYFYQAEKKGTYDLTTNDPKLVAFYLPQFHPIELNDKEWGKGFTEWTNVSSALPRFVGHEQPKLPGDLGFYDLRIEETMKAQVDLAKKHGISGFCFYYYWFSGKKILNTPIENFLMHKEWNFNFMVCWANENWTKRWDGKDNDVIISQQYLDSDPLDFIKDVEEILLDKRYIRKNGKPLLAVYRGSDLKNPNQYTKTWRDYFKNKHKLELEIVTMVSFDQSDPRPYGFDGGIEFEPMTTTKYLVTQGAHSYNEKYANNPQKRLDAFEGEIINYNTVVKTALEHYDRFKFPTYKSVTPSWDNDARKKGKGTVFYGTNPDRYSYWLKQVIDRESEKSENPLIFINAWNEWAEGAVLEPSAMYGHAYLNKTSEVLASRNISKIVEKWPIGGVVHRNSTAVYIHAFYTDSLPYLKKKLETVLGRNYDLFISTRQEHALEVKKIFPHANVCIVPNRGRDVLPFTQFLNNFHHFPYEAVLKIHIKKSKYLTEELSSRWFHGIVDELLTSRQSVAKIIDALKSPQPVMVGPRQHYVSVDKYMGGNKKDVKAIIEDIGYGSKIESFIKDGGYFAGTMFWCNKTALGPFIHHGFTPDDFESESGQYDGTLAHALERTLIAPAYFDGSIYGIENKVLKKLSSDDFVPNYVYTAKKFLEHSKADNVGAIQLIHAPKKIYNASRHRIGLYKNAQLFLHSIDKRYKLKKTDSKKAYKVAFVVREVLYPTSSAFIRILSPFSTNSLGKKTKLYLTGGSKLKLPRKTDIVVVQRTAVPNLAMARELVAEVRQKKVKLYIDTDDAFSHLDVSHPQFLLQKERIDALNYLLSEATGVWFSTKFLQSVYPETNSIVVSNTIDPKLWSRLRSSSAPSVIRGSSLQMVYMGTTTHDNDFQIILPVLEKLYKKYPDQFTLSVIGVARGMDEYPWLKQLEPASTLYPDFVEWFNSLNMFDIGLSPLEDSTFNKGKSDIKCLDYIAAGIRPVVSDVTAYANPELDDLVVRVSNVQNKWFETLESEILNREENRKKQNKYQAKGFKYIHKYRNPDIAARLIEENIWGAR